MNIGEFNPTHTLLIQQSSDDSNGEIPITNEIIRLYSDHDYSVHLCLLDDQIESDYPEILKEIRHEFDQSEDSGCYTETFPNCENALMSLLSIRTWHRFVSIASLTISGDEGPVLHYVPDHNVFEVDVTASSDIEERIESVTEKKSACLLPKTALAEWKSGGTTYAIAPPSLCIDNSCFQLSKLQDTSINEDDLSVSLSWSATNQRGAGLIEQMFGFLGSNRPSVIEFQDRETFESVVEAFSMIENKCGG